MDWTDQYEPYFSIYFYRYGARKPLYYFFLYSGMLLKPLISVLHIGLPHLHIGK